MRQLAPAQVGPVTGQLIAVLRLGILPTVLAELGNTAKNRSLGGSRKAGVPTDLSFPQGEFSLVLAVSQYECPPRLSAEARVAPAQVLTLRPPRMGVYSDKPFRLIFLGGDIRSAYTH
jgi:hypothetical protein